GRRSGHAFALETQGSVSKSWFSDLDWLILSPKPPSSTVTTDWDGFDACLAAANGVPHCALKIVIFDDADYTYARQATSRYPALPVYLQVGNPVPLIASDGAVVDSPDIA